MSKSTYDLKDKSIIHTEKKRLTDMSKFALSLDLPALIDIGLKKNMRVFDLGCGTGTVDAVIADYCSEGSVIGLDINPEFLREAKKNLYQTKMQNIDYILGEAEKIPLASGSVDFCYSRSLFQHLANPEKVIAELSRITKPGGIIAILDVDDAGLILYPEPKGFYDFLQKVQKKQQQQGGDRFIGRKLYSMLKNNFKEVSYNALTLTSKSIGNKSFINIITGYKFQLMQDISESFKSTMLSWGDNDNNLGLLLTFIAFAKKTN